jgi:hypothetical protein
VGNGAAGDADSGLVPYDGPYVHSRHGTAVVPWVWIANGTRPLDEVFAPPVSGVRESTTPLPAGSPNTVLTGLVPGVDPSGKCASPAVTVRVLGPVEVEG